MPQKRNLTYLRSLLFLLIAGAVSALSAQPVASFYANVVQGCNPLKVDFVNNSTGAVSYLWKFGNGNESTITNPGAVYNNAGQYTITLIATASNGKTDTSVLTDYITVFKSPVAGFKATDSRVCEGDSIHFSDLTIKGDGDIMGWKWDFGDGGTAFNKNPGYVYTLSGKFDVTLAVTDKNGCVHSVKMSKYSTIDKKPGVSLSSDINNKCQPPVIVNFTSNITGAAPFRYLWNFGDGDTSGQASPTHTFTSQGNFAISLAIIDANGCRDSLKIPNLVNIRPPVADFVAGPLALCAGNSVNFNNLSTPLDGTGTFEWDFGNGSTSTIQNPQTVYDKAGLYTVTLKYNWDGCSATKTRTAYIQVYDRPVGKISPRDTTICRQPGQVFNYNFFGKDVGSTNWTMNTLFQGNIASPKPFPKQLDQNGEYTIIAQPVSPQGCVGRPDTVKITIRGPYASFITDRKGGCIPYNLKATYDGTSEAPITEYSWNGLGQTGNGTEKDFVNNTFGRSRINLKITDINGCWDTTSKVVEGGIHIEPEFETIKKICRNQPFWIYNKSSIRHQDTVLFKYIWNKTDTLPFIPNDSMRHSLRDTPEFVGYFDFVAISYGCTTGMDPAKQLRVRVLGPKLDGEVKSWCDKDSFSGVNRSTHYTSSYWRYVNEVPQTIYDYDRKLNRKITQTGDLWLFAFNDTNKCADSMPFPVKLNPVPAKFTPTFNCSSREYSAKNEYPGLSPSNFTWVIKNTTTGTEIVRIGRDLKLILPEAGDYVIELQVNNPDYSCTPSAFATQKVYALPQGTPTVTVDRTKCYPVNLTLTDPSYNQWLSASWQVMDQTFKDSQQQFIYSYTGNSNIITVYLLRTDSQGCAHADTFTFAINGFKAFINQSQAGELCKTAVITFTPQIVNPGSLPLTYMWDFGYRQSTTRTDTLQVRGIRTVPVSLIVKDTSGCESRTTKTFNFSNGSPEAKFTYPDTTIACPPLNIQFTDQSSSALYPIVKRLWNFGDSSYSDKTNPGKLYIYPGKYSVTLIVTNSMGCTDTLHVKELVVVKGPVGSFYFDKKSGCSPLDVLMTNDIKGQIRQLELDMGDGAILGPGSTKYRYTRPGIYVPRLIIVDSNGCKYSPEPKDTIIVYPNPTANFVNKPVCMGTTASFTHNSVLDGDVLTGFEWKLNSNVVSTRDTAHITFGYKRNNDVMLKVTSTHGCTDSIVKQVIAYGMEPGLIANKGEYCLGERAVIYQNNRSDTTISTRTLWLDGRLYPDKDSVEVIASSRGKISALLIVEDVMGCKDTFFNDVIMKVGDTLPPSPITMYRTSVVDNFTTETKFNTSTEPDFKKYNLYVWMNNAWQLKASSENLNDTNLFVNGLNTLATSYCHKMVQVNYCGVETDSSLVLPHCTVEIKAKGDTNQARVWWNPYAGWNEVERYRVYRKKKDEIQFLLLDSVNGNQHFYIDTAVYCHVEYDYKIEAIEKAGFMENSWSDTARAKPLHYVPVPAPEVWRTTVNDNLYTHTEWITPNFHKYPLDHYTMWKLDGGSWTKLQDNIATSTFSIDDYATNVQARSYTYRLTSTDVCGTQSPLSNVGKSILLTVTPEGAVADAKIQWSPYIYWNEDVDQYAVERSISGRPFEEIGRVEGDVLSFYDRNVPHYCEKDFVYRVTAIRNQPLDTDSSHDVISVSNHATFLPEIRFFIPNAFTPNANNLNETFRPDGMYFIGYEMRIYNRYGQKVYEGDTCLNAWNGLYNGEQAPDGVYAYAITAWDLRGRPYHFNGTIHLLR